MILVLDITICHEFGFSNNERDYYSSAVCVSSVRIHLDAGPRLPTDPATSQLARGSTPSGGEQRPADRAELPTPTMMTTRAAAREHTQASSQLPAAERARLHLACLVSFRTEHARKPMQCTPAGMHCILFIQLHPYSSSYLYIHLPSIIVMQRRSTQWL